MSEYSNFAEVYDRLMTDVDYKARTEYLCRLFKKYDRQPTLLLDLACGTGGFSNEFAKIGAEVIGVDISEEMLSYARENSEKCGQSVLYLCQPAEELDLYGTVDGAVCCLDSFNHITDYERLCKAIERVALFLEKDRLFIFDVNTVYKHRQVLGNNIFVVDSEGVYCVWQNFFDDNCNTTQIDLDFFVKEGKHYTRSCESFCERAYTLEELENAVSAAGLETVAVFDDMTENPVSDTTERAVFITRKIKETYNG